MLQEIKTLTLEKLFNKPIFVFHLENFLQDLSNLLPIDLHLKTLFKLDITINIEFRLKIPVLYLIRPYMVGDILPVLVIKKKFFEFISYSCHQCICNIDIIMDKIKIGQASSCCASLSVTQHSDIRRSEIFGRVGRFVSFFDPQFYC